MPPLSIVTNAAPALRRGNAADLRGGQSLVIIGAGGVGQGEEIDWSVGDGASMGQLYLWYHVIFLQLWPWLPVITGDFYGIKNIL